MPLTTTGCHPVDAGCHPVDAKCHPVDDLYKLLDFGLTTHTKQYAVD